jgi:hypothetical protein
MVIMIDEIFDRHYQAGRASLNDSITAGLTSAGRTIFQSFKVLNRIEYQAPWASSAKRARYI